jgi:hypothetical protein
VLLGLAKAVRVGVVCKEQGKRGAQVSVSGNGVTCQWRKGGEHRRLGAY